MPRAKAQSCIVASEENKPIEPVEQMSVRIRADLHRTLKAWGALNQMTLSEIADNALAEWMQERMIEVER